MNLKNNKGYSGVDVSVAIIIIMLFIPTIFGMIYNINKSKSSVTREGYATNIATQILSMAKSVEYENIDKGFTLEDEHQLNLLEQGLEESEKAKTFLKKIKTAYSTADYNEATFGGEDENFKYRYFTTKGNNNEIYLIQVVVANYYPQNEENIIDLIKKVKVVVAYPVGSKIEKIDLYVPIENEKFTRKEILYNEI